MEVKPLTTGKRIFQNLSSALWRNRVSGAFFIIALSFLFLFLHILSFGGQVSQEIIKNFEEKADIPIVVAENANTVRVDAFRNDLQQKKIEGFITKYWELSQDDALLEFKKRYPAETSFLEQYNIKNPLRTVFGVIPSKTATTSKIETWILASEWHGVIDQKRFRQTSELRNRVQKFLGLTSFSLRGIFMLQVLFSVIAILLILYAVFVVVRSHREEISIMRLVGARLFYIRIPFILEGVILSVMALFLSMVLFWWFFRVLFEWIHNLLFGLGITESFLIDYFQNVSLFSDILWGTSLLILLLSFISAVLGVEHALRKTSLADISH